MMMLSQWMRRLLLTGCFLFSILSLTSEAAPPTVYISSSVINVDYPVIGTVSDPNLRNWELYYRPSGKDEWFLLTNGTQNIINGVLAYWDTTTVGNGYYELWLIATNHNGETNETIQSVRVIDNVLNNVEFQQAQPTIRSNEPKTFDIGTIRYDAYGGDAQIRTRIYSNGVKLSEYSYNISDGLHTKTDLIVTIPTGTDEGLYDLEVVLTNRSGTKVFGTLFYPNMIRVDNTPPVAELMFPKQYAVLDGTITLTGRVFDEQLYRWEISYANDWQQILDSRVVLGSGSQNVEGPLLTWNTANVAEGRKTLYLFAEDSAHGGWTYRGGNTAIAIRHVIIDHQPPKVAFGSSFISGANMHIFGTVEDVSLQQWILSYTPSGSDHWIEIARGDYEVKEGLLALWDVTDVDPGFYTLKLEAIDGLGRTMVAYQTDVVVLFKPELTITTEEAHLPWNVVLDWEGYPAHKYVIRYELWRRIYNADGEIIAEEQLTSGQETSYETVDQQPGRMYEYYLHAVLDIGTAISPTVTYWTVPIPTAHPEEHAIRLEWAHPGMDLRYHVFRQVDNTWVLVTETADKTVRIPDVDPNTVQKLAIAPAFLPDGGYPWRAEVEAYALWGPPGAPTYTHVDATEVTIQWDPPVGVTSGQLYRLYRDGKPIWDGIGTTYTDRGLIPNQTYSYAVAALNGAMVPGVLSSTTSVTTGASSFSDAGDLITILEGRNGIFVDANGSRQLPYVRTKDITLRWNLSTFPTAVSYGLDPNAMGENELFTPRRIISLTGWDGVKTIFIRTSDGKRYYKQVVLDTTPPEVNIEWVGQVDGYATLHIDARDNLIPIENLEMSINNGQWQSYTPFVQVEIPSTDTHALTVQVRDLAGNVTTKVLIDNTPPTLYAHWEGQAIVTRPSGFATLILYAEDDLTPLENLLFSIDDGPWKPYQRMIDLHFTDYGPHTITVRVRDAAGNITGQNLEIFVLP